MKARIRLQNLKSLRKHAFTLIELLVVLSVIALLIAILMPALGAGRHAARDLKCKANLRNVINQFIVFADAGNNVSRGESDYDGTGRFSIEDFQESVYQVDEFWNGSDLERQPLGESGLAMVCPSGSGAALMRTSGIPCSDGAVGPAASVSVGFNMRLHRRSVEIGGSPYLRTARLSPQILTLSDVPVVFDVSGKDAEVNGHTPYYAAPPVTDDKPIDSYETGNHWFPSLRHRGKMNVGFVGGYVLSSSNPTSEPWTRWNYQPDF